MSYRPMTSQERQDTEKKIKIIEGEILVRRQYLDQLRQDVKQGIWQLDIDFSKLPMPKPDCFLCSHGTFLGCDIGHTYGDVCKDYEHFSRKRKE